MCTLHIYKIYMYTNCSVYFCIFHSYSLFLCVYLFVYFFFFFILFDLFQRNCSAPRTMEYEWWKKKTKRETNKNSNASTSSTNKTSKNINNQYKNKGAKHTAVTCIKFKCKSIGINFDIIWKMLLDSIGWVFRFTSIQFVRPQMIIQARTLNCRLSSVGCISNVWFSFTCILCCFQLIKYTKLTIYFGKLWGVHRRSLSFILRWNISRFVLSVCVCLWNR